jgi:hypothetical protein
VILQLLDLEGHRRLSHEQGLGSLGETQMPGNGMKHLQTTVSHKLALSAYTLTLFKHKPE